MPPHISLAIIDSEASARESIEATLKPFAETISIVGSVDNFSAGLRIIEKSSPNVVILEVNDIQRGMQEVQHITSKFPRTSVIVSSSEKSSDWILSLMRAGAVEYMLRPLTQDELKLALQKVGRFIFSKTEEASRAKIISVYYPTGGMGTTTVAVNLAASLASEGVKVALVDLNLYSGDISTFLDVNPTYTLSSVTSNIDRLDANFLMTVMTRHPSGPFVLTEPNEVDDAISITPDQVHRILSFLRSVFTYVVVDCGGPLAGCNMAIFESSDLILFTTALSLPALKNSKRYLTAMERKGLRKDRLKLVVNRYLPKADIQIKDAEKVLGHAVFQTIPNDYVEVVNSINKGMPVVKFSPGSTVSKAILNLAELVAKP
ncbi:response regulator [Geomonas subterranea]|uniref:Response regulator n=1 Tax=Geomonas subterranea TaxID=2847989 RepID=A0ABX8LJU6_9BACT|nr:response regulator [Geomonas subterranea]QXE92301.1 response regulator [Geomonas subterranea]QXM09600.1 response regulator [Geomonas subterranea]